MSEKSNCTNTHRAHKKLAREIESKAVASLCFSFSKESRKMSLFVIPETTIRPNSLIDSTCCLKPFLSLSFLNHTSCNRVSGPSPNLFRNQRVRVHLSIRRHPIHSATCPSSYLHHIKLMDRLECFLYPLFFRYWLQSTRSRVPTNTQPLSYCD